MSKKVLFSHFSTFQGEGWNRSFILAKGLSALGYSVTFLTTQNRLSSFPFETQFIDNVRVVSVYDFGPKKLKKLGVSPLSILIKLFFSLFNSFDIVHADNGHRPVAGLPCRINRFVYNSIYVTEWWDYFGKGGQYDKKHILWKLIYGKYDNWMELNDKRKADGIVPLSNYLKSIALSSGIDESKVMVINGGADNEGIKFYQDNKEFRKQYGIPLNSVVFCFIGINDSELRDNDDFIEALKELKNMNIVLLTTGKFLSKEVIKKYSIDEILIEAGFLDYNKDYSELISCADFFISVLKNNKRNKGRWPNKIGDYLAAGRPILVSRVGDIPFYIEKEPNIFIDLGTEKKDIINNLKIIILNNKFKDFQKIRNYSEKCFDWKYRVKKLEEFYHQLNRANT